MSWTKTRSQIAHAKKHDPQADVTELQRTLRAERLEEYIRRTVDAAPPLTAEQRDRLALLLRGGEPPGQPLARKTAGTTSAGTESPNRGGADAAA